MEDSDPTTYLIRFYYQPHNLKREEVASMRVSEDGRYNVSSKQEAKELVLEYVVPSPLEYLSSGDADQISRFREDLSIEVEQL